LANQYIYKPITGMASVPMLTYLFRKAVVVCIRTVIGFVASGMIKQDAALIPARVKRERIRIPSRGAGRFIDADLYSLPPGDSNSDLPDVKTSPPAILVNFQGAGFICSALGTDALFCSRLVDACGAGLVVLDADYRKGPETTFPGPQEDIEDVLRWVAQSERFDAERVALSGFSSGATLALCAAASPQAVDIRAVVATYPLTDVTLRTEARVAPQPVKPLPGWMMDVMLDCYVPDRAQRADPRVSPAHANLAAYPPTVAFLLCDGDNVMPEANRLADRLEAEAGKKVIRYTAAPGIHHGFDKGTALGSEAARKRDAMYAVAADTVREVFGL
jgi:acetyl esterase/lipase